MAGSTASGGAVGEWPYLEGAVVLVTGSTSGIGRALAQGFSSVGARVWVHGRNQQVGEKLAHEVGGIFVMADLAEASGAERLASRLLEAEERLDVLVNNAGIETIMPVDQIDLKEADLMWRVNVRAPIELVNRLMPLLRAAQGASVVNVTSIHEWIPYAQNSVYSATKAALAMFTRTAAIELGPLRIRVNNLAPGVVETDINREVLDRIGHDRFRDWIPLARVADVSEIVQPALFLASRASGYVTGSTLVVDGGYSQNLVRYRPLTG